MFQVAHERENPVSVAKTKYVIEVAVLPRTDANGDPVGRPGESGDVYFGEAGRTLRGRLDPTTYGRLDTSEELRSLFSRVGVVPGEMIWADLQKGLWGTLDPLHEPADGSPYARKLDKLNRSMKEHFTGGHDLKFEPPAKMTMSSDDDKKNVLYWMRRLVDSKRALVVDGSPELPPMNEILAMPGRRKVGYGPIPTDQETRDARSAYDNYVPATSSGGSK